MGTSGAMVTSFAVCEELPEPSPEPPRRAKWPNAPAPPPSRSQSPQLRSRKSPSKTAAHEANSIAQPPEHTKEPLPSRSARSHSPILSRRKPLQHQKLGPGSNPVKLDFDEASVYRREARD